MVAGGGHGIREHDNEFSSCTGAGLLQRYPTIPVKRHFQMRKTPSVLSCQSKGCVRQAIEFHFLCPNRRVHSTPSPSSMSSGRAGWGYVSCRRISVETTGNCRPGRGRVRSRRLPISSTLRDRAFPCLHVSGEMRFSAREYKPKGHLGSIMCFGSGIEMGGPGNMTPA